MLILIAILQLPLVCYTISLSASLAPGQDITDLAALSAVTLLLLLALPYAIPALSGIEWKPKRGCPGGFDY